MRVMHHSQTVNDKNKGKRCLVLAGFRVSVYDIPSIINISNRWERLGLRGCKNSKTQGVRGSKNV